MKRSLLSLLFLLPIILVFTTTSQAQATICYTFDFTQNDGGWTRIPRAISNTGFNGGVYASGTGWEATQQWDGTFPTANVTNSVAINYSFGGSINITNITVDVDYTPGYYKTGYEMLDDFEFGYNGSFGSVILAPVSSGSNTISTGAINWSANDVMFILRTSVVNYTDRNTASLGSATITSVTIECDTSGDLTAPLQVIDASAMDAYNNTVVSISNSRPAFVHSPGAGTITALRRLTSSECASILDDGGTNFCGWNDGLVFNIIVPEQDNFWLVQVTTGGDVINYLVVNANQYVTEGMSVDAGCYLGETGKYYTSGFDVSELFGGGLLDIFQLNLVTSQGVTVARRNDGSELISAYVNVPTFGSPCNSEYSDCIGSTQFDVGSWTMNNATVNGDGSISLSAKGSVQTQLNLDSTRHPQVEFFARSSGDSVMDVQLGNTTEKITVTSTYQEHTLDGAAHTPDVGGLYTLRFTNVSFNVVNIQYVCVSFTEDGSGGEIITYDTCIFQNYNFADVTGQTANADITAWAVTATDPVGSNQRINVESTDSISQSVDLIAGDYTLRVVTSLWFDDSVSWSGTDTNGVDLYYTYPLTTGSPISIEGTVVLDDYFRADDSYVFETTVTVTADTSDDFLLEVLSNESLVTGWNGITIETVCLTPQFETEPDTPEEPFVENCEAISQPSSEALSSQLRWHWHNFKQFFECELMILLNDMYGTMKDTYTLIGWMGRWSQASIIKFADFFTYNVVWWLEGHFANIANGRQTFIEIDNDTQCNNLFCLVDNFFGGGFDILGQFLEGLEGLLFSVLENVFYPVIDLILSALYIIIDLIADVLERIIELLFDVFNLIVNFIFELLIIAFRLLVTVALMVLEMFREFFNLFNAFISAWNNSEPRYIPGLPDCEANPQDGGWCIFLWFIENTVFSNTGSLIIPLIVGFASIMLLLWGVKEFKQAVFDSGGAI